MQGTGAYIPDNKVYNSELDEHFDKNGAECPQSDGTSGKKETIFYF